MAQTPLSLAEELRPVLPYQTYSNHQHQKDLVTYYMTSVMRMRAPNRRKTE